jgi:glutaryl-CoA dehydrogenase (non-decarboxylating)
MDENQGMRNTGRPLANGLQPMILRAAAEAIQVHGAYGYSDEYDVERYLRNARCHYLRRNQ